MKGAGTLKALLPLSWLNVFVNIFEILYTCNDLCQEHYSINNHLLGNVFESFACHKTKSAQK